MGAARSAPLSQPVLGLNTRPPSITESVSSLRRRSQSLQPIFMGHMEKMTNWRHQLSLTTATRRTDSAAMAKRLVLDPHMSVKSPRQVSCQARAIAPMVASRSMMPVWAWRFRTPRLTVMMISAQTCRSWKRSFGPCGMGTKMCKTVRQSTQTCTHSVDTKTGMISIMCPAKLSSIGLGRYHLRTGLVAKGSSALHQVTFPTPRPSRKVLLAQWLRLHHESDCFALFTLAHLILAGIHRSMKP